MKASFKRNLLGLGIIITGVTFLSACHTVQGTVQGAGKDIQTVANTVAPKSAPAPKKVVRHHKKKVAKKTKKTTNTDGSTNQTTTTTTTDSNNAADTTTDTTTTQ